MDLGSGIRGAVVTTIVVIVTYITVLALATLMLDGFLSGFETDADPFAQASGIVLWNLLPLFILIPLSFLYNGYEKGSRERLYLRTLSVAVLILTIVLMTGAVEYKISSLALNGMDYVRLYRASIVLDISSLRYILLVLPALEILLTVSEYRQGRATDQ